MTTPRKPSKEPSWCARANHHLSTFAEHASPVRSVGSRRPFTGRGEVTIWLQQSDDGPTWVGIGAAHMAYVTVEVSLDDAERLTAHLTDLVRRAREAEPDP